MTDKTPSGLPQPQTVAEALTDERMDEIMRVVQAIANRYAFVGDAAFPRGREKLREVLSALSAPAVETVVVQEATLDSRMPGFLSKRVLAHVQELIGQQTTADHIWLVIRKHLVERDEAALSAPAVEPVAVMEAPKLYVYCRECSECGHVGINDDDGETAACNRCDWSGPSPKEDRCPGCDEEGAMTSACPKCGARSHLLAEAHLAPPPPASPAEQAATQAEAKDGGADAFSARAFHDLCQAYRWTKEIDGPEIVRAFEALQAYCRHAKALAAPTAPTGAQAEPTDADGEAFREAARLGLTLRFYGGCAQSGMPGSPCAYEVVNGSDRAASMREAVSRAAAVIANGGESQRLGQEGQS